MFIRMIIKSRCFQFYVNSPKKYSPVCLRTTLPASSNICMALPAFTASYNKARLFSMIRIGFVVTEIAENLQ